MDPEVIRLGLWPNARTTRIVAVNSESKTILRATLSLRPSSCRALPTLLEAIALWEGHSVRAALVAGESSTSACQTTLFQDTFAIFGDRSSLYELDWVLQAADRRRATDGSFAALERLLQRLVVR